MFKLTVMVNLLAKNTFPTLVIIFLAFKNPVAAEDLTNHSLVNQLSKQFVMKE